MHARALFKFLAARSCWFVRVAWNRYRELELRCSREEKIRLGETLHGNHGWIVRSSGSLVARDSFRGKMTVDMQIQESERAWTARNESVSCSRASRREKWRCLSQTVNVNVHYRGIKSLACFGTVFLNRSRIWTRVDGAIDNFAKNR